MSAEQIILDKGQFTYEISKVGQRSDGSYIYSIRVNYGWKTPYLKEGSKKFNAILSEALATNNRS